MTDRNASAGPLRCYAESHGVAIDVLALHAAVTQPWVDVVLSGAVTVSQLSSNLKALEIGAPAADLPDITESPAAYWAQRATLKWN